MSKNQLSVHSRSQKTQSCVPVFLLSSRAFPAEPRRRRGQNWVPICSPKCTRTTPTRVGTRVSGMERIPGIKEASRCARDFFYKKLQLSSPRYPREGFLSVPGIRLHCFLYPHRCASVDFEVLVGRRSGCPTVRSCNVQMVARRIKFVPLISN